MIALDKYLYCLSFTTPGGGGCGSQDIELGVNGSRHSEQDISGKVGEPCSVSLGRKKKGWVVGPDVSE